MRFIALLRGINVGGNNKISMQELKLVFERGGMLNVSTYINSGNVIFDSTLSSTSKLARALEKVVEDTFGFTINIVVLSGDDFLNIAKQLPASWTNDVMMKCDVMFLWNDINDIGILQKLALRPDIDEVKYTPGAVIWAVDRRNIGKSGMMKLVGTELYKKMTIRNCNTVRKLAKLIQDL